MISHNFVDIERRAKNFGSAAAPCCGGNKRRFIFCAAWLIPSVCCARFRQTPRMRAQSEAHLRTARASAVCRAEDRAFHFWQGIGVRFLRRIKKSTVLSLRIAKHDDDDAKCASAQIVKAICALARARAHCASAHFAQCAAHTADTRPIICAFRGNLWQSFVKWLVDHAGRASISLDR